MRWKRFILQAAAMVRSASVRSISDCGLRSRRNLAWNSLYSSWLSPGMTVCLLVSPWRTPLKRVFAVLLGPVERLALARLATSLAAVIWFSYSDCRHTIPNDCP